MSSRDAILAALGGASERPAAAPPLYTPPKPEHGLLVERFAANLAAAGGSLRALPDAAALDEAMRADPRVQRAQTLWSSVAEVAPRLPEARPSAPHALAHVDLALLHGALAVAESGAVWWVPSDPLERAAGFLAERVVLVVPRERLVADLHEAYARIDIAASPFGCFVCGPSKTADIEQALVIGAHGPRALEVWFLGGSR